MRHVLGWSLQFAALWLLWMLLAGEWNRDEWISAAAGAAVAATFGELARTRAGLRLGRPAAVALWKLPWAVVSDFAILMWALPRRRRGVYREKPRADVWPAYLANLSPNSFVVEMDEEHVLLHDLVVRSASEEPL